MLQSREFVTDQSDSNSMNIDLKFYVKDRLAKVQFFPSDHSNFRIFHSLQTTLWKREIHYQSTMHFFRQINLEYSSFVKSYFTEFLQNNGGSKIT